MSARIRARHIGIAMILAAGIAGSCGGGAGGCTSGCSCMEPLPTGFPTSEEVVGAIQVRLSQSGIKYIEDNASTFVSQLLPTGLDFDVPPICGQSIPLVGSLNVCASQQGSTCAPSSPACKLSAQIKGLKLTPQATPGNVIKIVARVAAKTPPGNEIITSGAASCKVTLDTAATGASDMAFLVDLKFEVDPTTKRTRLVLENPDLQDLDNGDIKISGTGGIGSGIVCGLADLFFKGLLIGQLKGQIGGLIGGLVDDQLCAKCDMASCPGAGTCNAQKVCMAGNNCLQSLGLEGRLLLNSLPGASPDSKIDLLAWLGGAVAMPANGATLALIGGMTPTKTSSCVKPRPDLKPSLAAVPRSAALSGNTRPDGKPFDIGIGIHQRMLDFGAWSLYTSGGLCLEVGSELSTLLSADAFSLIMPSLNQLTSGSKAPVRLVLRPGEPPKIKLGAGVVIDKGNGNYEIQDPLLNLELPQLAIDFFVLIDDRYVRILRLTADVDLPMALVFDSSGNVLPVLGKLDKAFGNLKVEKSELLSEPPSELEQKFPVVLNIALGQLPDLLGASGFSLPDLMGIKLKDPQFTSVDNKTVLAIFAGLEPPSVTTSANVPLPGGASGASNGSNGSNGPRTAAAAPRAVDRVLPVELSAKLRGVTLPDDARVLRLARPGDLAKGPRLRVDVPQVDRRTGKDLEYAYRLDSTTWSPWLRGGALSIASPLLFLRGEHQIELRARLRGEPRSASDRQLLTFRVEPPRPAGSATASADGASGCSTASGAPTGLAVALLSLLGLVLVTRRRRLRQLLGGAALGALLLLIGACSGSTPAGDGGGDGNGGCPAGQYRCKTSDTCEPEQRVCKVEPQCQPDESIDYGGGAFMNADTCQPIPKDCTCTGGSGALAHGILGRYSALAASGGTLFASGYEQNFGDLVLVTAATSAPDSTSIEIVDGVPANAQPTHETTGYRGGVSAKGEDVGTWTDVTVDANDKVLISYHDVTNRALKMARRDAQGSYAVHTVVAPTGAKEIVGRGTSIAIIGGVPAIAFTVLGVPGQNGAFQSELRVAVANSATPAADTDWTITVADSAPMSCAGLCASNEACFLNSNGSSACQVKDSGCASCASDEACLAGNCAKIATEGLDDVPQALGLWPRLVDAAGAPLVVYYDGVAGKLRAARQDTGAWTTKVIAQSASDNLGTFPAAAVDSAGLVHVTYQNRTQQTLAYLQLDATTLAASANATVDDGARSDGTHPVGADSALAFDGTGALHIVYQDQLNSDLLRASRNAQGTWEPVTAGDANIGRLLKGGDKGYGFFSDLATDGGAVFGSSFFFDAKGKPRGNLELFTVP
ncbi:MAG: hypothetical protein KC503_43965 [Myxococcales bacterium]|nr:hypothetical protein [Myxococcales bacterium]